MTYIMFQLHGIAQYANYPNQNYSTQAKNIKIYYELLDNMIMIPNTCATVLNIKACAIHESLKNIRYISGKYMLKRSTYGWHFLEDLSAMIKNIFSPATQEMWEEWSLFKSFFFQHLFSSFSAYKNMYNIQDMDAVERLQSLLGEIISQAKSATKMFPMYAGVLDQLDKDLYDEFL